MTVDGLARLLTLPLEGRVGEGGLRSKLIETGWGYSETQSTPTRPFGPPSLQGGG